MLDVIIITVLGVIISVALGTFWYSMSTPMGRLHMESIGFTKLSKKEQEKAIQKAMPNMWKTYLMQMMLSLLTSFFIAFVTKSTVQYGGPESAVYFYVSFIWIAFTVPMIGQNILWGDVPENLRLRKFFSDSIYNLITYILIATIAVIII